MFKYKLNNLGFSLIEIMVGIIIVSIVMIGGFQALTSVNLGKVRLMSDINTQKQIIYFQEKLFEDIKKGGLIDFEEYFNRKVVGTSFSSGHYLTPTGFGNFGSGGIVGSGSISDFGDGFYQCISLDGFQMSGSGCYDNNYNIYGSSLTGEPQRYGQYSFQFIDYNSNYDEDGGKFGDEDLDGSIIGDDDDEYLGEGPIAFSGGTDLKELYLISGDKKSRTFFRWRVYKDPEAPISSTCSVGGDNVVTGSGCLGTIEFLKLEGVDYGLNHSGGLVDSTQYDGVIDTWLIDKDFSGGSEIVAGSNTNNYWVSLFPEEISVSDFKIFLYPNTDHDLSWKSSNENINLAPYVRIGLSMGPSWAIKKQLKGNPKDINFSTTISLTDIFSK